MTMKTEPAPVFNPHTATTDDLRNFLGNFEAQFDAHIAAAPQFVRYQGSYPQGEINLLLERGAITIHQEPCPHIRVRPAAFDFFQKQKEAMNILKWRRESAKKHELADQEKYQHPVIELPEEDEIDVAKIDFI